MKRFVLRLLPGTYVVCRLDAHASIPDWAAGGEFVSVTRTADELSIVCEQSLVPPGVRCEPGWRCYQLEGPIPFTEVGVLKAVLEPLAAVQIGVFAISTFDTDCVLVKESDVAAAKEAWIAAGIVVVSLRETNSSRGA
jgi:hypothetical protein